MPLHLPAPAALHLYFRLAEFVHDCATDFDQHLLNNLSRAAKGLIPNLRPLRTRSVASEAAPETRYTSRRWSSKRSRSAKQYASPWVEL